MRVITKQKAMQICGEWHNGQWSKFYQFASSGEFITKYSLIYIRETLDCLSMGEYAKHPYQFSKKDTNSLNSLKRYFEFQAKRKGIAIDYIKHPIYGYLMPTPADKFSDIIIELPKYVA